MVLNEDVATVAGDSGGSGKFDGGFIIFMDDCGQQLGVAEIGGELAVKEYIFGTSCQGLVFCFARAKGDAFLSRGEGKEGCGVNADADGVCCVTGAVGVTCVRSVSGSNDDGAKGVVGWDGGECGAEVGVTFEIAEELKLVVPIGYCG